MYVVLLKYKQPLASVEQHLTAHRTYLEQGYQQNYLVVSGPQNPRVGGVLISQLQDKTTLENFLQQDPFYLNDIATFEIIEFNPVKYHPDFAEFLA